MTSRPTFDLDRDAQILALWQGRPRQQRRATDVDMFCQWLIDYAPWLVRGGTDARAAIGALVSEHTIEDDDTYDAKRWRRPNQERNADPAA